MKQKIESVIKELERWGTTARQQQKLSRDEKKQWYFLSRSNACSETIGLLRRTFNKELSSQTTPQLDRK